MLGADPERCLAELDPAVADEPGLDLATANDIHVSADTPLRPEFRARFHARANAAVHPADFAGDAAGVRARINDGVARTTRGLVTDLLQPADVTPETAMLLVNVLWMKAVWTQPFDVELTRDRPFHAPGGTHPAPTMHRTGPMHYAQANGWRMVTLAGRHGVSLDVLLPEDGQEAPGTADLAALYQRRRTEQVRLALPRFRAESRRELGEPLRGLGATGLFDGDYGGISGSPCTWARSSTRPCSGSTNGARRAPPPPRSRCRGARRARPRSP
ncbi:serpin family protein [Nocardiopsis aegyptia]|uniref:Serine protease inhibitor n=1 Tax=Nocardiopsis aegyptia TaxID=220378 RepID=A0A7Z0ESJ0_9ACTN|nr:serine protease inhibitor [Nocardiopsis aegyptia]